MRVVLQITGVPTAGALVGVVGQLWARWSL